MTYEELLALCEADIWNNPPSYLDTRAAPYIYVRWETGGMSGGNCWGDHATPFTSTEDLPEFTSLDNLLRVVRPEITYLQYKALVAELQEKGTYREEGYYGNSRSYAYKAISVKKLYLYLQ